MEYINTSDMHDKIEFASRACAFFNKEGNEAMVSWEDKDGSQFPYNWIAVRSSKFGEYCDRVMIIEPADSPVVLYDIQENEKDCEL